MLICYFFYSKRLALFSIIFYGINLSELFYILLLHYHTFLVCTSPWKNMYVYISLNRSKQLKMNWLYQIDVSLFYVTLSTLLLALKIFCILSQEESKIHILRLLRLSHTCIVWGHNVSSFLIQCVRL